MIFSIVLNKLHFSKDTIIAYLFFLWIAGWLVFIIYGVVTSALWNFGVDLRPYIDNAPNEIKMKEKTAAREKWRIENPTEAAREDRKFKNHEMLMERLQRECAKKCLNQYAISFEACYEIECK